MEENACIIPWPQTTLASAVHFLPILFPMIDPVEYKILEEHKTDEFGGNVIWLFSLRIIVYGNFKVGNVDDSSQFNS